MVARVQTFAFYGLEVRAIDVQVHIAAGLPAFTLVGLPDKAVGESRERVRAALQGLGLSLPAKRITVNLSPADVLKEGSHYDLPIALGVLCAMDIIAQDFLDSYVVMGELALDGRLTPVSGILPAAIYANAAERGLICPAACGAEAAWAGDMSILAPETLYALLNHYKGECLLTPPKPIMADDAAHLPDMRDIRGQETARRALEIAASGGHNLLMIGPPGAGKSMLAARLPSILPPLSAEEALDVSMMHSISGLLKEGRLVTARPFRDPHHSASLPSLVGGGLRAKPGEISLAHRGVLFLDELPEFSRQALESLRQPLETGNTTIARANAHITYPCRFQLIAAMNPCRCGYAYDASMACSKMPRCAEDYQSKISGPIYDRIDMHIDVMPLTPYDLAMTKAGEDSAAIAKRVAAARLTQRQRYEGYGIATNAELNGDLLYELAMPHDNGKDLLNKAAEKFKLSARGYNRILRVARTIADMEGVARVSYNHIAEALSYRRVSFPDINAVLPPLALHQ